MADRSRLVERGFLLKQASLDSMHEKNVRHGHISKLHIWPARRPLAARRAALIELAPAGSEERSLLESISNHIFTRPASADDRQTDMFKVKEVS